MGATQARRGFFERPIRVTRTGFSSYLAASAIGVGSNFGEMCERASLVTHASIRCRACDGSGYLVLEPDALTAWALRIAREQSSDRRDELRRRLSEQSTCRPCRGSGYVTPATADRAPPADSMFTTVRCGRCRGCGETTTPNDASAETEDVCLHCGGKSFLIPVTVREKGSSKHGRPPKRDSSSDDDLAVEGVATPAWVDEDALLEMARASRVLGHLRREHPAEAAAAEAFDGPEGDKWGSHCWGRMFALWPLTQAGRQLAAEGAARSRGRHGFLISPLDLIASERDAEFRAGVTERNSRRRALIAQADRQARELWRRTSEVLRLAECA